ncbi:M24 family metallopeptidase [Candidatus Chloroploca mongolica]|nr:Xaa-Pro peptidase family protein [Candidatus Chloroploca mongolica]
MMRTQRIERIVTDVEALGLDGLVLTPDANLHYFTGLHFHHGKRLNLMLIPTSGASPCLVVPALEQMQAETNAQLPVRLFPWADQDGPLGALAAAVTAAFGRDARELRLAIEPANMAVMHLRALEAVMPGVATYDATHLFAGLRMVKDADEMALIERAVQIVETALHRVLAEIKPGMTERTLSRICTDAIIAAGADEESFANLIASGPNGASPHHLNSDRPLQQGELIILDCGARYRGYVSDITRTVALGEPAPEAREVYELVQRANAAGRAACRPGATGTTIDAATRDVIAQAGYGEYFIHRTGHGFGLETHELPQIVAGSDQPLVAGTTFTVEPGIYLPGRFGVRIEDDMVLTADGARSLTTFSRELIVL